MLFLASAIRRVQGPRVRGQQGARARGFTLLEVLVAIAVSVILLTILAFVMRISVTTMRDANGRASMTERLRSINIRVRQELGGMLPVPRGNGSNVQITDSNGQKNNVLVFATATSAGGRSVSVDVKYEFIPDAAHPENGRLVRYRDATGPYDLKDTTKINPAYVLGDDLFAPETQNDVLLTNVRSVLFEASDPPPPAPLTTGLALDPKQLPSAIKMTVVYGPDLGDPDAVESGAYCFSVYRGQ